MSARSLASPAVSRLQRTVLLLARIPARLHRAAALSRSRKGLLVLDDHLLRDVGLTRAEAQAEASRPVWEAPAHWKA